MLHGDERFLVDETSRATLEAWKADLVSDFGYETLEGTGLNAARLQDSILQMPFLDPYRAVFARMTNSARSRRSRPATSRASTR